MMETDVLIVGGGASGLTSSLLLSQLGVDTLLVSKYAETSTLPKAHLLSMKSMEIFRELGLEPAIRSMSAPPENMRYVAWYAGLAGPGPDYGREIARLGAWGRGHQDLDWRRASACGYANLMQARLEPLLRSTAETRSPGRVLFYHNYISAQYDADGVTATIEDRATGEHYEVRARYLLACDGGRVIGPELGVAMEGDLAVATSVSLHFTADLSAYAQDSEVLIRTIFNPDYPTPVVLIPVGPKTWGQHSEQWVLHLMSLPGDFKQYTREEAIEAMQKALGLPGFEPEIHGINRWPLDGVVASQFRVGRAFMLGDAAHRMPPAGGHGMNTAIQDSYNLCWKLAAVLRGSASDALLDTYEEERRPVAQRTVASAFANWQNGRKLAQALNFAPHRDPAAIWQDYRLLWNGKGEEAEAYRRRVRDGLMSNLTNYNHANLSFGHTYATGALIPAGSALPTPIDAVQVYEPSTLPGCSLPHATLEDLHGSMPVGDLLGRGGFVMITDRHGEAWRSPAQGAAKELGVALRIVSIDECDAEYADMRKEWLRVRGVSAGGAILVRPDRFVAWRSEAVAEPSVGDLRAVLAEVLRAARGAEVEANFTIDAMERVPAGA